MISLPGFLYRRGSRDVLPERIPAHRIRHAAHGVAPRPRRQLRLFSIWAALASAQAIAVEAQQGFEPEIRCLAAHNGVSDRVQMEIALAGGTVTAGATAGAIADDQSWAATPHGAPERPAGVSVPQLMSAYQIDRIGLLKVDIEGGEFAVFGSGEDQRWLDWLDQVVMEVHGDFGYASAMVGRLRKHGFDLELCDNEGTRVSATSSRLDYAYCRRS